MAQFENREWRVQHCGWHDNTVILNNIVSPGSDKQALWKLFSLKTLLSCKQAGKKQQFAVFPGKRSRGNGLHLLWFVSSSFNSSLLEGQT